MSSIMIRGPVGNLEAEIDEAPSGRYAVLCHPHPRYGGTMDDAVVGLMRDRWMATGGGVLRFNFRSVGASEGKHDVGLSEFEDVVAVVEWLRQHHDVEFLLLGGYSFGASMALQAVPHTSEMLRSTNYLLLIAPPTKHLHDGGSTLPPTTIISGTADTFVDVEKIKEIEAIDATDYMEAIRGGLKLRLIEGADHFFQGSFDALEKALTETFESI